MLKRKRDIKKEGFIQTYSMKDKKIATRYLFLFEDILVIGKPIKNQKYILEAHIRLDPIMKLQKIENSNYQPKDCEFILICKKTTFTFYGNNSKEAETWYQLIEEQLLNLPATNEIPFSNTLLRNDNKTSTYSDDQPEEQKQQQPLDITDDLENKNAKLDSPKKLEKSDVDPPKKEPSKSKKEPTHVLRAPQKSNKKTVVQVFSYKVKKKTEKKKKLIFF